MVILFFYFFNDYGENKWENTPGTNAFEKVDGHYCALLGAGRSLWGVAFV